MLKISFILFWLTILMLTGCTSTEVPARLANTYAVTGKVYCDTPIFHNIESMVVRWIQASVAPEWEPVCSDRRENAD
jgi:hypothetical protein|tara:strand:+ start:264 stop:494 length:231 start_codon:yes stop_codon:yes gene_type:complete